MVVARPTRRLTADARRQAILMAARSVFGSTGYERATTRDIAAAAGVSEALLYQHFDGKRRLFEAVIAGAAADLEHRLAVAGGLDAAVTAFFDFVEEESDLYRVFFRQALQADPAFETLYRDLVRTFMRLVEEGLSELGRLSHAGRDVATYAIAGLTTELALWWVDDRSLSKAEVSRRAAAMARAAYRSQIEED